ncbi:MAG TPA: 50S ribosomal protein L18 [Thermotogota bacterium]|nr:50S ribosomal protein L18 [Thermotogota bacterium]HPJ88163.1 50S ribosomal protein L18 [Thermotogota bacterium]HPR95596.1 50S ribosomal protein L18 [Thermotogota bacterium]
MIKQIDRKIVRKRRHFRVRKKVTGTPEKPRLAVFRSEKHIYAQIIDDVSKQTLCSSSTISKSLKGALSKTWDVEAAAKVGEDLAKKALDAGIEAVVFDRGGFKYHGRVKALADGARKAGLKF